jgi:acyl carrier protein
MHRTDVERQAALAAVRSVMSRVFGIPECRITEATRAADIDRWDSLNMIVVAIGLERRLGRPVAAASFAEAGSVGALLDALTRCE